MPGLVVFRRRWSVGSDDLVVPGAFLLIIHFLCIITVIVSLSAFSYDISAFDIKLLFGLQIGYLVILFASLCVEMGICVVSMKGSILDSEVRATINIWIYLKTMIMLFDLAALIMGSIWISRYYLESQADSPKKIFFAIVIANWALVFITFITVWCTFDAAGRSWVKMKKYQRSMRETESRFNYKRSNSMNRNWRQRKVIRAYQDSWDHRCRLLFCCIGSSERNRNSFTDIARLLSDFFRELDVVPSDVVAGLVLLRKFQRLEREAIVRQRKNGTYEFLSGVPITENTQFLALNDAKNYDFFQTVIHYMYFAQGAYGWPMYFLVNRAKMYNLIPELRCFGCCNSHGEDTEVIKDNCCYCNYAALKKTLQVGDIEIIYATFHVDVGETPFFVAIDYTQKKIVVSIRGTLSMKDILTDLNAEAEVLPLNPPRDDWLGHKGMVQAAIYIQRKLKEEAIIEKALNMNTERNTQTFGLVFVGHSLGAGTAAILAILMKPEYPTLQCFSYSPPGGLLSMPAVEYSKSFITSVVLGKDVVPRIGLYQMEALRADLINAIQRSIDPKWKTISCSIMCCGCGPEPTSVIEMSEKDTHINKYQEERDTARSTSAHPTDSTIALTLHQPLYPPGRIIHIVRHHPKPDEKKYDRGWRNVLKGREPVYQAIWAESIDFDEVLISPVMLQDHMPDTVLAALKKVVTTSGPRKPHRQASNAFSSTSNDLHKSNQDVSSFSHMESLQDVAKSRRDNHGYGDHNQDSMQELQRSTANCETDEEGISSSGFGNTSEHSPILQHRVCLETSFTNLNSPLMEKKQTNYSESVGDVQSSRASSLAGSVISRSRLSSIQVDISSIIENGMNPQMHSKSPIIQSQDETVLAVNTASGTGLNRTNQRFKSVVFDMDNTSISKSPSPQGRPKSILHRQHSAKAVKPKSLAIPPLRRASDVPNPELIHDDWLGLAPLASPETLSEISSISSRNSIRNSIGTISNNKVDTKTMLDDIYESQLHTPIVLRRAPKFSENLATCAEDSKNLAEYERLSRVIIAHPLFIPKPQDSSDDDDSFESANSFKKAEPSCRENGTDNKRTIVAVQCHRRQNSKSADQLDDIKTSKATNDTDDVKVQKLTFSDSNILNDTEDLTYNSQSMCSVCRVDSQKCVCHQHKVTNLEKDLNHTGSEDTSFYSANSSVEHVVTYVNARTQPANSKNNGDNYLGYQYQMPAGCLESHFPHYNDLLTTSELYTKVSTAATAVVAAVPTCISNTKQPQNNKDENSILVQISERSFNSPNGGRKRKIFPCTTYSPRYMNTAATATTACIATHSATISESSSIATNGSSTFSSSSQQFINESSV